MNKSKLKKRRLEKNFTQVELGKKTKLDQRTISSYELGRRTPSIARLKRIAKILECEINDLL